MSKLSAIKKQIAALEARAQRIAKSEMGPAIAKVKAIMAEFNLTIDHLTQAVSGKAARKNVKAKAASVAKYADPKTGKQWSGFGRAPNWIASAKNRDAFLIDKSGIKAAEPVAKAPAAAKKAAGKKAVGKKAGGKVAAKSARQSAAKKPAKKVAKQAAPAAKKLVAQTKKAAESAKKAATPAAKQATPAAKKEADVVATTPAVKRKPSAKKVAAKRSAPTKTTPKTSAAAPAPMPVESSTTPTA